MAAKTPLTRKKTTSARTIAIELARLALARHCRDIVVLDLRRLSPVTDFFVIATGTSARQMASLAREMADISSSQWGNPPFSTGGLPQSSWVLIDFIDVVVHLFDVEHRSYYDLRCFGAMPPEPAGKSPLLNNPSNLPLKFA